MNKTDASATKLCAIVYRERDTLVAAMVEALDEIARLKGALALGQENCDAVYEDLRKERDEAVAALGVVMGDIDFTKGACRLTDMVGQCLSKESLAKAHAVLAAARARK